MRTNLTFPLLTLVLFCLFACQREWSRNAPLPPNIIFILADDLGYGDLSCYGQQKFRTPNIDRLAAEGMRFTQHYAGSTVCAPSRSVLLTGLHTGHTPIRANKEVQPEGQWPLPAESFTLSEMLKRADYVTGAFGKWGLGYPGSEGEPNRQGIDRFYGYNCQRLAHHYYPYHLWNNQDRVLLTANQGQERGVYGPQRIHQKALEFLEINRDTSFFLFYPSLIPHAELFAPESYLKKYRGNYPPEKAYHGVDSGADFRNGPYGSQPESHAAFAAMVRLLDDQVGEIIAKLEELGLTHNTLIIFSSDNGPHLEGGADPDFFNSNGPLRGYKRDLYEGGIRVPLIVRWPGVVKAGAVTGQVSAFWDFFPTLSELAGDTTPYRTDGLSLVPTLTGSGIQQQHDYLYWEFSNSSLNISHRALRAGPWKLVQYQIGASRLPELYHLEQDPAEERNLATEYPEKVVELQQKMRSAREPSKDFPLHLPEEETRGKGGAW